MISTTKSLHLPNTTREAPASERSLNPALGYRSPLRYPGGKQRAIASIAKVLPQSAREYREPLVGGGSVYFYARTINLAERYWINDAFEELVSFWQIIQKRESCKKLIHDLHELRSSLLSTKQIKQFYIKARQERPMDDYRQALLFFFFNRVSFSGTTKAGGFSALASSERFTASSIERLASMPEALAKTKITNLDFEEAITKAGKDVFIFLDPPYYKTKKLYGRNGSLHDFDHERLANILKTSKHKFLITYDSCAEVRSLYKWAEIRHWHLQYGMNNCNSKRQSKIGAELFISNY